MDFQLHNYAASLVTTNAIKDPAFTHSLFDLDTPYQRLLSLAHGAGLNPWPVVQMINYHSKNCPNKKLRYWGVVAFHLHSKEERFYEFDIEAMTATKYQMAHGKGSDMNFDGYLDKFSNVHGSLCSSKGLYLCAEQYYSSKFGKALRLDGLEPSNSNVRGRGVVLHGADYASKKYIDANGKCGRSEGCFAFAFIYSSGLVDRFKNGSFIYAWDGKVPPEPVNEETTTIPTQGKYFADWDGKAFAEGWTADLSYALELYGKDLLTLKSIKDANKWCPRFGVLTREQKKQFFIMLISSMARQESGFDPKQSYTESFRDSSGKRVVSRGLLQISKESANSSKYKGGIKNESELHDVGTNLIVGVKILNYWIPKDGYIGSSNVSGIANAGGGRYWSVMRDSSRSHKVIVDKMKALKFT